MGREKEKVRYEDNQKTKSNDCWDTDTEHACLPVGRGTRNGWRENAKAEITSLWKI